jgi:hypothetical protein
MKNYLSSTDLAMWIALIAGEVILCLCVLKRHLVQRLPWFSTYVFALTAENLLLIAIAFKASYSLYYYVFYVTEHLVTALAFITLIEFGRQVLPGLDLPKREKALLCLLAALTVVIIFAALWPLRFIENRIEVAASFAIAITFIFVTVYSRYLSLYWSRLLGGVSFPLGLLYLTEGVVSAITGHYPDAVALQIRVLSQVVNLLAVITWIVVVLSPWGEYKMTEDDLRKFQEIVEGIEANFRRFVEGGPR